MEKETLWRQFEELSPEAQQEVSDLIAFLRSRHPRPAETSPREVKLEDEPFVGQWKDRQDIQDSAQWVGELRRREWREPDGPSGAVGHKRAR